jgi:hypothetical protein
LSETKPNMPDPPKGKRKGLPPRDREAYLANFRLHVHTLLWMGYERLDRGRLAGLDEPSITGELVRSIREAMAEDTAPDWVINYSLRDDPPLDSPGRFGRSRPRVDIEFERVQRGARPCYHWEAKPLRDGSSIGAYLGDEGLGCYLSGLYARGHDEAGMLGYVEVEDERAWATRIEASLLRSPQKFSLLKDGAWSRVSVVSEIEHSYRTRHRRQQDRRPITVYHALLRLS